MIPKKDEYNVCWNCYEKHWDEFYELRGEATQTIGCGGKCDVCGKKSK